MNTGAKKRIGFIGLGIMGNHMAGHLMAGRYQVNVFNRSRAKGANLIAKGAKWFDSIGELAAQSEVIISMVGYPSEVEELYFSAGNILDRAQNAYLIDMTTSSPSLA
ncbi:MAG: NAD(P)-binding domain-containing protein, partial [bacterium]